MTAGSFGCRKTASSCSYQRTSDALEVGLVFGDCLASSLLQYFLEGGRDALEE